MPGVRCGARGFCSHERVWSRGVSHEHRGRRSLGRPVRLPESFLCGSANRARVPHDVRRARAVPVSPERGRVEGRRWCVEPGAVPRQHPPQGTPDLHRCARRGRGRARRRGRPRYPLRSVLGDRARDVLQRERRPALPRCYRAGRGRGRGDVRDGARHRARPSRRTRCRCGQGGEGREPAVVLAGASAWRRIPVRPASWSAAQCPRRDCLTSTSPIATRRAVTATRASRPLPCRRSSERSGCRGTLEPRHKALRTLPRGMGARAAGRERRRDSARALLPAFVAAAGERREHEGARTIRDAIRARRGAA